MIFKEIMLHEQTSGLLAQNVSAASGLSTLFETRNDASAMALASGEDLLRCREHMILNSLKETSDLKMLADDYALKILQVNQELILDIQRLMTDLSSQNQFLIAKHLQKKTDLLLQNRPSFSGHANNPLPRPPQNNSLQNNPFFSPSTPAISTMAAAIASIPSINTFKTYTRSPTSSSPSPPRQSPKRDASALSKVIEASPESGVGGSYDNKQPKSAFAEAGIKIVELIEELREVADDTELNPVTAEERLNHTWDCLSLIRNMFDIETIWTLEKLKHVAKEPDTLKEKERDTYYYSILVTYLNIAPNKHGLKPEHLLWSQEKVRHYISETRISHIWKEICPLKEWVFHRSLEKKQGKKLKNNFGDAVPRNEKRTQYQNWPAVVFPLLLKDHFLAKLRKVQPGIPEPGVVNNAVLAHRKLRRDQARFSRAIRL